MNAIIQKASKEKRNLLEPEALKLAEHYGLTLPKWRYVNDAALLPASAGDVGYPLALKLVSPDIIHKSDFGAVKVNIQNEAELTVAVAAIVTSVHQKKPDAEMTGWLIAQMIREGHEFFIGGMRDPQFGPVIVCGMGGIFVELFRDTSMRLTPVTTDEATQMIMELSASKLLMGFRGQEAGNIDAFAELLVQASKLLADNPEINELDFNPVKISKEGAVVLDARIILK